jgi:translation factor GUF1, mitochondrial
LTDRSITVQRDSSTALGQGLRLGFLGMLHMDVFRQRLEDEYDANIIITAPTVPYKGARRWLRENDEIYLFSFAVVYRDREEFISNPTHFPDSFLQVKEVQEPVVKASIIVPEGRFVHTTQTASIDSRHRSRLLR